MSTEQALRLMNAAPELLEALQKVYHYLDQRQDVSDGSDGEQWPNEAMSLLTDIGPLMQAAIFKATGEQQ
jgi:hypothetical protein